MKYIPTPADRHDACSSEGPGAVISHAGICDHSSEVRFAPSMMNSTVLSSNMIRKVGICCAVILVGAFPAKSGVPEPKAEMFQGGKADAKIREFMRSDWRRQKWQIEKKAIDGSATPFWHVKGTMWKVNLEGPGLKETPDSAKLDPTLVYEFTGIPIDESYGVITFYLYSRIQKVDGKQAGAPADPGGADQPASAPVPSGSGSGHVR